VRGFLALLGMTPCKSKTISNGNRKATATAKQRQPQSNGNRKATATAKQQQQAKTTATGKNNGNRQKQRQQAKIIERVHRRWNRALVRADTKIPSRWRRDFQQSENFTGLGWRGVDDADGGACGASWRMPAWLRSAAEHQPIGRSEISSTYCLQRTPLGASTLFLALQQNSFYGLRFISLILPANP
jgi:hypothetical protein